MTYKIRTVVYYEKATFLFQAFCLLVITTIGTSYESEEYECTEITRTVDFQNSDGNELEEEANRKGGLYYTELTLGTPSQKLEFAIDTGSSDLVVAGSECTGCRGEPFVVDSSSSASDSGEMVSLLYGSASGEALVYTDSVGLDCGPLVTSNLALVKTGTNLPNILGLAYANLNKTTSDKTFFDHFLLEEGMDNVFSLRFCRDDGGESFLHLGGISDKIDTTSLIYTPIVNEKYFSIKAVSMSLAGESVGNFDINSNIIIDSGTTLLHLPREMISQIVEKLKESASSRGIDIPEDFWEGNPETENYCFFLSDEEIRGFPTLSLTVNDENDSPQTLSILPQRYLRPVSDGAFFGIVPATSLVILGQVFMENFDTVFDRENKKIGFAVNDCSL